MEHFAYSFLVSMLHSLWQAALLFVVGKLIFSIARKQAPIQKRNFLLCLLAAQVALTGATFYIIYSETVQSGILSFGNLNDLIENSSLQSWSAFIFWIYTCIILFRSLYLFISWKKFIAGHKLAMQKPPIHLRVFTAAKALEFGIHRKVFIWCSEKITTPVTYGFLKPVILLPIALVNQLTIEEAETLIIHELTHIKNKDFLWNWLVIVMEIGYFFNPFIYYIAKQIKQEREKSCDVQVIHFKYSPLLYAQALLKTAQTRQASLSLQLGAIKGNQELLKRIHFFSNSLNFNFRRPTNLLSFLFLSLFLVLNIFLVSQLASQKNELSTESANAKMVNFRSAEIPTSFATKAVEDKNEEVHNTTGELTAEFTASVPSIKLDHANKFSETNLEKDPAGSYVDEQPMAISVANLVPVIKETKEVLIQETNSDGDKITIALQAELKNGVWMMQPLWMLSETKNKIDSTTITCKDSVVRVIPSVQ